MRNILHTIPFIRILLGFIPGIIISSIYQFSSNQYILLGILTILIFIVTFLHLKSSIQINFISASILFIILFFFGYIRHQDFNKQPDIHTGEVYFATLNENPIEKTNSYKAEIKLSYCSASDKIIKTDEKIVAYFQKDNSTISLTAGSPIMFAAKPSIITNPGNPFEFDYKRYLSRKKIYRQVYIPSNKWEHANYKTGFSVIILAERVREKLLDIYRDNNISDENFGILSALTLGYKEALDPETKQVFTSAGAMHVLAVSGLHVGIIYLAINLLLGFFKKHKNGIIIFLVLSILIIWFYAFITGMPPSVFRAATMFSIVIIGENLRRPVNIYNTLASSAFILLFINPNLIFEVGFQLSYSAVIGIVFFQPRFYKLIEFQNKILDKAWALLTVSLAAQIATLPFTLFYFHQYPTYSLFCNLIVIPAAFLFIFIGMAILITSPIKLISSSLAFIADKLVGYLYESLDWIQNLPGSTIQDIDLNMIQFVLLGTIIIFTMIFIVFKKGVYIYVILTSAILFFSVNFVNKYEYLNQKKVIIYNTRDQILIHLISGKNNYVVYDNMKLYEEYGNRLINSTKCKLHLNDPVLIKATKNFDDKVLYIQSGVISFYGKHILIPQKNFNHNSTFLIDIFICQDLVDIEDISAKQFICCKSLNIKNIKNKNIHLLPKDGAYSAEL